MKVGNERDQQKSKLEKVELTVGRASAMLLVVVVRAKKLKRPLIAKWQCMSKKGSSHINFAWQHPNLKPSAAHNSNTINEPTIFDDAAVILIAAIYSYESVTTAARITLDSL